MLENPQKFSDRDPEIDEFESLITLPFCPQIILHLYTEVFMKIHSIVLQEVANLQQTPGINMTASAEVILY